MMRRVLLLTLFSCLLLFFLAGCAGISVFSSKHEHYYEGKHTRELLRNLEKRVQALEAQASFSGLEDRNLERSGWELVTKDASPQVDEESITGRVKIKSLIDGADLIKLREDRIWYEHDSFDLPGMWKGRNEPTIVNDQEWIPEWEDNISKPFVKIQPPLPSEPDTQVYVSKMLGRGDVYIVERPNAENDYTLSIYLDDSGMNGADWYEVLIEW